MPLAALVILLAANLANNLLAPGAYVLTCLAAAGLLLAVALRGVLYALLARRYGLRWAVAASSLLFGLWHVLPSLELRDANAVVGGLFGSGPLGAAAAVAGAVAGTAAAGVAFCELRRRSGSLLA